MGQNAEFEALWLKAHEAGMAAVSGAKVVPMVVQQHASMVDDSSRVVKEWFVEDGVCGFAWVNVHPGTSKFARWMKEAKGCSKGYPGGMQFWIHEFNQSMQKKEVYAHAFAKVLQEAGIKAYAGSRLD